MQHLDLGQTNIIPAQPVVAGSFTTITLTYTAGHPIDDSGYLKIVFRSVTDFGSPQFVNPAAPNYCTISTNGDCHIEPRWDPKGHTRPWDRALFLKIRRGFLDRGEEITVVFGDTSGGSPGWQMQTFCVNKLEFKVLVDPIATYQFKELSSSPTLRVVPGDPMRAVCIAPSSVLVNQEFTYYLKLEDRWGNPIGRPYRMVHPGWNASGVYTIVAQDKESGLSAESNPIDVLEGEAPLHLYWADFHGQTEETVGSNTIEDYFTFARDFGLLDIAAHQGNDFQITDEFWEKINQVTSQFYKPGVFVTFPGYEWSGNTPLGGDRNIYFTSEGGRITRSSTDLLPGNASVYENSPTAKELFANLAQQDNPKPFAFAHVGGRYADISVHDPAIELAVEIHSAWGTFEWLLEDALQRGYRIGVCANSDGHKCRPGASYPGASTFGSFGGLTCILARELNRESVFEALTARHFYATTGNRCLVAVKLITADGRSATMGDVIKAGTGTPHLYVRVVGTAPIESVKVLNGQEVVKTLRPFGEENLGCRLKVTWSGAEVRGRDRKVQWDGSLQVLGNTILDVTPINFWNASQPLKRIGNHQLAWTSITTGGVTGIILSLEKPDTGSIKIDTLQHNAECEIASLGLEPRVWDCGGLRKEIKVYRLPDRPVEITSKTPREFPDHKPSNEFSFTLPLTSLHKGDNPIYICMNQEDGHMAWTSPIYLI